MARTDQYTALSTPVKLGLVRVSTIQNILQGEEHDFSDLRKNQSVQAQSRWSLQVEAKRRKSRRLG